MITAYSTLASYGYKVTPHLIEKVEDANGNILYEYSETKEAVLSKSIVYIINELLSNCYSTNFVDYNYPTCLNIAAKLTNKYSMKTGSTDSDALVFGYNSNIVMGVWAGYDDNSDIPSNVSSAIKNIWADTIESYFSNKEATWYDRNNFVQHTLYEVIRVKGSPEGLAGNGELSCMVNSSPNP